MFTEQRRYSIAAITSVSQTEEAGSTPVICSIFELASPLKTYHGIDAIQTASIGGSLFLFLEKLTGYNYQESGIFLDMFFAARFFFVYF